MVKLMERINFFQFMAVISIIGFSVILIKELTGFDLSPWVEGLLFIIIGVGLLGVGNVFSLRQFFEGGISNVELAFIMAIVVGALSIGVGIVSLPLGFLEFFRVAALGGIKIVIALFAIAIIVTTTWFSKEN